MAVVLISTAAFAQSVTLTFTAKDAANQHVQLHRVSITNLTKGWQETIYWPDTTLTMQNGTGISDIVGANDYSPLWLSQNNPNPFTGTTEVNLMVATEGTVALDIADINGRIVVANDYSPKLAKSNPRGATNNPFTFGDQMEYVGYATINGSEAESQRIMQAQGASQTFTLQFAETQSLDVQACPEAATVTDVDNNTYNTVQIGNQCWMKENLRTTHYSDGTSIPLGSSTSNTTAYYYVDDNVSNVSTYGYLYNWKAVMRNSSSSSANPSGVQGICPTGWHVPSDAEWTQLTDYVSSQTQYQCNGSSEKIAKALASTTGWNSSTSTCAVGNNPSANNATGFSALPAGYFGYGDYYNFGYLAYFWSATEYIGGLAYDRVLNYYGALVYRDYNDEVDGISVRCVRD